MSKFWNKQELENLYAFHDELTTKELAVVIKTRSVHSISHKLRLLELKSQSRTCRYCFSAFKPKRRDQIFCCQNCCQLKARWRNKVAKARQ